AREQGIDRLIQFGADVTSCRWNGDSQRWTVTSADGRRWDADALILATGQLPQPAVPATPGRFEGHSFHSASWDHPYALRGKRVLFSSHYLPALQRPGVELVTDRIAGFDASGVRTADGVLREVDCVIYGTGFRATDFMFPMEIVGAGGRTLRSEWMGGAHAHL